MASHLSSRQAQPCTDPSGCEGLGWWGSAAGYGIRYGLVGGLIAILVLYFLVGYLHAAHRLRKGQQPLAYHRWMVRTANGSYPYQHGQPHYTPAGYREHQYPMHGRPQAQAWAPPPPVYNYNEEVPPAYAPPPGASKVDPDQHIHVRPRPSDAVGSSSPPGPRAPLPVYRSNEATQ